jgi:hypothetical protein
MRGFRTRGFQSAYAVACFWMGKNSLNSAGSSSSLYNRSLK